MPGPATGRPRDRRSAERVVGARRLATLAARQAVKCFEVCSRAPLSKEGSSVHGRKFLRDRSGDELVDTDAVGLGPTLDLGPIGGVVKG